MQVLMLACMLLPIAVPEPPRPANSYGANLSAGQVQGLLSICCVTSTDGQQRSNSHAILL